MLRKVNHPGFAKLNWVYYTRPTFFKGAIEHTPVPGLENTKDIVQKLRLETVSKKLEPAGRHQLNHKKQFDLLM